MVTRPFGEVSISTILNGQIRNTVYIEISERTFGELYERCPQEIMKIFLAYHLP